MKTVTIAKEKLRAKIAENRDKHVKDYTEALEGYRVKAKKVFAAVRERVNAELTKMEIIAASSVKPDAPGFIPGTTVIELFPPENHAGEYDTVLSMLEMSSDETITLDAEEYQRYVLDNWSWKLLFDRNTMIYKAALGMK